MKFTNKTKTTAATISGVIAIGLIAAIIFSYSGNTIIPGNNIAPTKSATGLSAVVPPVKDRTEGATAQTQLDETMKNSLILDVGGNPKYGESGQINTPAYTETSDGLTANKGTKPGSTTSSTTRGPSAVVTIIPDATKPKTATPNPSNPQDKSDPTGWVPPQPGEGAGVLIFEGPESIAINTDKSVETLQRDLGLLVGYLLLEEGYNSLYPNASPRDLAEDANKNYARTGNLVLNPSLYDLPKVVGTYSVKLPATGTNSIEAADYISEFMKSDPVFNEKVRTVFATPKDGWLSVYQKDGFFYILYVAVDIGYSSFD